MTTAPIQYNPKKPLRERLQAALEQSSEEDVPKCILNPFHEAQILQQKYTMEADGVMLGKWQTRCKVLLLQPQPPSVSGMKVTEELVQMLLKSQAYAWYDQYFFKRKESDAMALLEMVSLCKRKMAPWKIDASPDKPANMIRMDGTTRELKHPLGYMYNGFARAHKASPFPYEEGTVFMNVQQDWILYLMDAPLTFKVPNHESPDSDAYVFLCCALWINIDVTTGRPGAGNVGLVPLDQFACCRGDFINTMIMDRCKKALSRLVNPAPTGQPSSSSTEMMSCLSIMD